MGEPEVDVLQDPSGGRDVLRHASQSSPTAVDSTTGAIWVFGYDEIDRLAHDSTMVGVGLTWFELIGIAEGPLRQWYGSLMFTNEGDTHGRLRRVVGGLSRRRPPKRLALRRRP